MHELSIVLSIIDTAEEQARQHGAPYLEEINLEIGELASIEPDALEFAWEAAVPGTVLERARRNIRYVPARARCLECAHEFAMQQLFETCPQCGSFFNDLLEGRELKIKSLVLASAEDAIS
jgi:hydrogenase nickel incorporation protein HypA/HybF